jgi:GNAT superfamily N-acetyltransferase
MEAARRRSGKSTHRSSAKSAYSSTTGSPGKGGAVPPGLVLRRALPEDAPGILDLLSLTLGWQPDERHRGLFAWKHYDNPFGPSPSWVAVDGEGVVGVRMFMRWGFLLGDRAVKAVRAVDTATHPRARGMGVFRALTLRGVDQMKAEGVDWVFNTPNDQSLEGYLTMGWRRLGRLPVVLRPANIGVVPRLKAARVAADLWSVPTSAGEDAASVLAEGGELAELLASQAPGTDAVRTARSAAYLRWRYGAGPVGYRALLAGSSLRDGVVFFRVRRRGPATEVAIADALVPAGDAGLLGRLGRRVLETSGGDYAIVLGPTRPRGWLRLPRVGPVLTWRALTDAGAPPIEQWKLSVGDVELF